MKRRPNLALRKTPKRCDGSRWCVLNAVSKVISGFGTANSENEKRATKTIAFTLGKALSIEEPLLIPHPRDEKGEYEKFMQDMTEIAKEKNCDKPLEFHSPLLVKYAFSLNKPVLDRSVAWMMLKQRLSSLKRPGWTKCQKKLDGDARSDNIRDDVIYPFPKFIQRASESLQRTCEQDRLFVYKLHETTVKAYPERADKYRDMTVERRANVFEINRWASILALCYLLCKSVNIGRSKGLEAVTEFFLEIGDVDELERYCQVLDVETATYRSVKWNKDGKAVKLEYILDDSEREPPEDQSVSEDEMAWWHWVENVLKELHRSGQECDDEMHDRILRILLRIDRNETKTEAVRLALRGWYKEDRE